MGSWSARGRNGGVPLANWYGALCEQVPHEIWMAYIYDLNRKEVIWRKFFNTAKEAKQALDVAALGHDANQTNLDFSMLESRQWEGSTGYSHWQGDGSRETQGPVYIFWQGGGGDEGPQSSDSHHWQLGN